MTRGITIAAVALFVVSAQADHKSDMKKLEGVWTPIAMEIGGTKMDAAVFKESKMTLSAGTYSVVMNQTVDQGTFQIDTSKKPFTLDLTGTKGPNKDKTFPAIYDFDGEFLRICYDLSGKTRPTEFKATQENGFLLSVFKPVK
jgi:uncharacterized protein (TIGR03067 family)